MGGLKTLGLVALLCTSNAILSGQSRNADNKRSSKSIEVVDSLHLSVPDKKSLFHGALTRAKDSLYVTQFAPQILKEFQAYYHVMIPYMDFLAEDIRPYYYANTQDNDESIPVTITPLPRKGWKRNVPKEKSEEDKPEIYTEPGLYTKGSYSAVIANNPESYNRYSLYGVKPSELTRLVGADKSSLISYYMTSERITHTSKSVRGTIIHEIGHCYIDWLIAELSSNNIKLSTAYTNYMSSNKGADFIEEGICEYGAAGMGEIFYSTDEGERVSYDGYAPKDTVEILDKTKKYDVFYRYASQYVKPIIDKYGMHDGVALLLVNAPPKLSVLLEPKVFYDTIDQSAGPLLEKMHSKDYQRLEKEE